MPAFWVVDPRAKKPSLTVFELAGECYRQVALARGFTAFRLGLAHPEREADGAGVA